MNNNTKMLAVFAVLMLLGSTASAASAYDNALSMANLSVSPNPVIAGGHATIRFQLYNSFGFWLYSLNLQPTGSYPLLNVSPLNSTQIGQLNGGLNTSYRTYTIAIPNSTPSGVYNITFKATYYVLGSAGTVIATSSMPVSIYVQNKPAIKVVAISPQPPALYAGHNQTIQLAVVNTGYGTARNVSVTISGQGINLLSSVTTFFISNLTQGSTVNEPVLIAAQNSGYASILANVAYSSSNFKQHFSSVQSLNLSVASAAQFNITSSSGSLGVGATDVPVNFRITNMGTSTAQQVQLSLQTTYPITPVASTAYIGNLSAGGSTNVTFLVSIDTSGVSGNYPVTVYEQWKQPNGAVNQQFSGSNNYFVKVGNTGNSLTPIIIVIVIVIVVVVVYRFRKQIANRQKQKK